MQGRAARHPVKPFILEPHVGWPDEPAGSDAPARTLFATHLEQIREIIVEQQRQLETHVACAVILQTHALIGRSTPQEHRSHDVKHVFRQHDPPLAVDVGVGEIDGKRRVVVAQVGAQQQRLHLVQEKFEPRQITGIGIEQAVGTARGRTDITMAVEHDEGIIVLQRTSRSRGRAGHRNIEWRFPDVIDGLRYDHGLVDGLD